MRQLKITNNITSRESLAFEKYLLDIGRIDLLSVDEEAELARRIKNGDDDALEKLVRANLRFVVSVAKQYQSQGLSLPDLINEGNVGLMKAARRFDETKGFKFISYAVWWIRQSILQAIVEYSRMVRLPYNRMTAYNKVNEAWVDFVQKNEREPTIEEIAEILDVKPSEIVGLIKGNTRYVSVDAPITDDENAITMVDLMSLGDEDSPDLKLMEESIKKEVLEGLGILSPREVQVIEAYYGLNGLRTHSYEEIAQMYSLSKERVRQIKERAIRRMRKSFSRNSMLSNFG
ncbi:MAG: RNA polymerase sigma factor RpoD/SigA [Chitinophagales bacterium]|nr:RNA polymerase sigma factor RpoD/SigA [Chitinophagales bacterium]